MELGFGSEDSLTSVVGRGSSTASYSFSSTLPLRLVMPGITTSLMILGACAIPGVGDLSGEMDRPRLAGVSVWPGCPEGGMVMGGK